MLRRSWTHTRRNAAIAADTGDAVMPSALVTVVAVVWVLPLLLVAVMAASLDGPAGHAAYLGYFNLLLGLHRLALHDAPYRTHNSSS